MDDLANALEQFFNGALRINEAGETVLVAGMLPVIGAIAGVSTAIAITIISCLLIWVMVDKTVDALDKAKHWIKQICISWLFINLSGDILVLLLTFAEIKY